MNLNNIVFSQGRCLRYKELLLGPENDPVFTVLFTLSLKNGRTESDSPYDNFDYIAKGDTAKRIAQFYQKGCTIRTAGRLVKNRKTQEPQVFVDEAYIYYE